MMNYPPNSSSSGYSLSETLEHLVSIRQSLLDLLRNNGICQHQSPTHSLFSSRRNFRADELHVGLTSQLQPFGFSVN